ncbi:nuclear transport factor 2 family protein [Umezawaea sp. Da 62-37]|uniref:YybH family protein n=1 Tax=Umezawaea sp. Da 62-37 TaxID=3075927 RepID=UPI0028F71AD4|nr:nuclear transport factor 2 family protein [Umezawaea sp. Da 62-37]WNV88489.1 nuclear transport factor 2 family protein [Umezawaea sp. Da 62-37]
MNDDIEQIRALVTGVEAAMEAKDAELLLSRYTADAVTFDLAPPLRHVGPEVHDVEGREKWFSTFDGPVYYKVTDLEITAGEDVAFCHGLNRMASTPDGAPEGFTLWFRMTTGLRKENGSWRISHEHTSTPFYMDGSFRAATDLTPPSST